MTSPTGPTGPDVDRAKKIYRIPPGQRRAYIEPMILRAVTGEYKHGNARVPFGGVLRVAHDPIRQLDVVIITPADTPPIAVNLSSLYDIRLTHFGPS